MDVKAYVNELIAKSRAAQAIAAEYDQATVKKMVRCVAKRAYDEAETCAKMALEETGKGNLPSKTAKQAKSCMWIWYYLKQESSKSVGVVEDLPELGIQKIAKPAGIAVNLLPITNPTATPTGNALYVLFARDAMIVCPHPGAKKASTYACNMMRDELKKNGYPEDLIQVVEEPSMEISRLLMEQVDFVIATGGPSVVKAAYSSGKPSFGVGQGNAQSIVAPDWTDFDTYAKMTIASRSNDNGMPCVTEQTLHIERKSVPAVIEALKANGAYMLNDDEKIKVQDTYFTAEGKIVGDMVGKDAKAVAKAAGISVPDDTVILMCMMDSWGKEKLSREMMIPFCRILPYDKVEDAIERARENYLMEGAGHNGAIYTFDDKIAALAGERIPVCRLSINNTPAYGGGCNRNNGVWPTNSLGCGFWGGNSISHNLTYKDIMNYTWVLRAVPGIEPPTEEEVFAE